MVDEDRLDTPLWRNRESHGSGLGDDENVLMKPAICNPGLQLNDRLPPPELLQFQDITMNLASYRVTRGARAVRLPSTEFRLLRFFLEHPRQVFSRRELTHALWGPEPRVQRRTIDVHVRRLRNGLNGGGETDLIRTVRATGYAMDVH